MDGEVLEEDLELVGTFAIRGITYQNDDGTWREDNYRNLRKGDEVFLRFDANEYDPNSVLITSDCGDLGYIPKNMTYKIRNLIGRRVVAKIDGGRRIRVWYDRAYYHSEPKSIVWQLLLIIVGVFIIFGGSVLIGLLVVIFGVFKIKY